MKILAVIVSVVALIISVANLIMDSYEARTGETWEEKVKQLKNKEQ